MNLKRMFAQCLLAAIPLLLAGCYTANTVPLSKSPDTLRDWMLKRTPLGSTPNEVYTFIKHQQWEIDEEVKKDGTQRQVAGHAGNLKVISSSVRCDLGITHYVYFPFPTEVYATWAFDRDDRLIDFWADQQTVGSDATLDPTKTLDPAK
jgi:hypothetical protein